jgi:ferredoxin
MKAALAELIHFHRASEMRSRDPGEACEPRLRPALLAPYRDLSTLRYDYPLILVENPGEGEYVRSLSGVLDRVLQEIAPQGIAGERLRQHVLQLEAGIRALAARGARGSLAELWDLAARQLLSAGDAASVDLLEDSVSRARSALRVDGRVVDCVEEAPPELVKHAWAAVHEQRVREVLEEIDALAAKLSDILKVDSLKSQRGRSPKHLERSVGTRYEHAFDFGAWSRILTNAAHGSSLPESRRRRIREALSVLRSQRFFASPGAAEGEADLPPPHSFVFESCESAVEAFRERIPEMVELIEAIAIAELEIENRYRESKHDAFFRRFDESSLVPEDVAHFPSYLICLRAKDCTAQEKASIIELLSSGLPIKILVQSDDVLTESMRAEGGCTLGAGSVQLAGMAVALRDSYVLQSASASLYQVRDRIREGLCHPGPALFSVFSGSSESLPNLPAYFRAAAATQSRAFPTFSYDPGAGESWAARLHLEDNPQPEADWPLECFAYQDPDLQRVSEDVAFTFVDFAVADRRYASHLARVARGDWNASMVPAWKYLELDEAEAREKVPYILTVDADDVLHRLVVDRVLIRAARRCLEKWHSLQELAGIRHSRAQQQLLERERAAWERELEERSAELAPQARDSSEPPAVELEEAPPPEETEAARDADEPYIETPRCTTCDECTGINPRMFAYDDNKQAYIADLDAGTFRELVEAAETCQVSIIHPGKPRNPGEPGLAELIERAEPFR